MTSQGTLLAWWRSRAPRERILLAVMVLAIVAFLAWFAVLRPLGRWQQEAAADRLAAVAALEGVRTARAELATFRSALPEPEPMDASVEELLTRTAAASGVALARKQVRDGLVVVGIDAVEAPALLAWLDALARQGVAPVAMETGERDGSLHAELAFAGAALPRQAAGDP